ncbi:hypothetical protein HOH51_00375, partial [bacterium]|nr:hypothetical protein [bacterium]
MKISVSSQIFDSISHLHSNFVYVEGLEFKQDMQHELYDGLNEVFSRLRGHKSIVKDKQIQMYQELLEQLGLAHASVSTKSMVELIVEKKKDLILNHPIIDFYNYFSLHTLTPIGAYDADRIDGDILIRKSIPTDSFKKLGQKKSDKI